MCSCRFYAKCCGGIVPISKCSQGKIFINIAYFSWAHILILIFFGTVIKKKPHKCQSSLNLFVCFLFVYFLVCFFCFLLFCFFWIFCFCFCFFCYIFVKTTTVVMNRVCCSRFKLGPQMCTELFEQYRGIHYGIFSSSELIFLPDIPYCCVRKFSNFNVTPSSNIGIIESVTC